MRKKSIALGVFWKLMERLGVQGTLFVLQLILARILDPEHYGILSLMLIFVDLANVFIQSGFSTALVQNKDVTEEDCSSVFWLIIAVATGLYALLFLSAPFIAAFYDMPDFTRPFRVLCLVLFTGSFNSVQRSIVSRRLDFKKIFKTNFASIVISGIISIVLAKNGAGLWALVAQKILNSAISCVTMRMSVKWTPRLVFNIERVKVLFSFGWKLLASNTVKTLCADLRSLVIGKKFDADTLGLYNRGKHFPQFLIKIINTTLQDVMLPAMASEQDDRKAVKELLRHSMMVSAYVVFPMMTGLAVVAEPLVRLILTDKWLPCVPYLQIYCVALALNPVHICNLQAYNAIGRSDISLALELIKQIIAVGSLIVAALAFESPVAIAITGIIVAVTDTVLHIRPNRKYLRYGLMEMLRDILPSALVSMAMFAAIVLLGYFVSDGVVALFIKIITGVIVYLALSAAFRLKPFKVLLKTAKSLVKNKV